MTSGGLGQALERARLEQGLSRQVLARELNLAVQTLEAIEEEQWDRVQEGLKRPLARQLAERLGVDPLAYPGSWERIPGGDDQEPFDPRRERAERVVTGLLAAGSVGLLAWLVVPGSRIPTGAAAPKAAPPPATYAPARLPTQAQPFPVLGEVLPEAPRTAEGVLVSLRALDACEAAIEQEGGEVRRTLQVSEPWTLRVKGGFAIRLLNAGVVKVEVAGRLVPHGQAVGEPWTGSFDPDGRLRRPEREAPKVVPAAPETDAPPEEKGGGA